MPFGDDLAGGLGFLSNFPTPAAPGLGVAASIVGALSGPGEAEAINPYADHWMLFDPGGALWGAPLTDRDYTGGNAALEVPTQPLRIWENESGFLEVVGAPKVKLFAWLFKVRRSWSMPAAGTRCAYFKVGSQTFYTADPRSGLRVVDFAPGEVKNPVRGSVLRVSVLNHLLAEYRERQIAMAASSTPSFHYIDLRSWSEAELEYWLRCAPRCKLAHWRALKGPRPNVEGMSVAQRHIYDKSAHAFVDTYYADAKAEHLALLERNRVWYESEKAIWLEWKKGLERRAAVADQAARLEQAIQDYVASSPDPDRALAEVAAGQVRFALDDHAPSVSAHGASGGSGVLASSLRASGDLAPADAGLPLALLGIGVVVALLLWGGGE